MSIIISIIIFLIGAFVGAVITAILAVSSDAEYADALQGAYEKGREAGMKETEEQNKW